MIHCSTASEEEVMRSTARTLSALLVATLTLIGLHGH
jgi:hypothetical protein